MKKRLTFATIVSVSLLTVFLNGCSTTSPTSSTGNTSQREALLTKAGFISKTVTTPKQQQQVAQLAPGVVSAVKYKGKLYYVYPTGNNQVLVGRQSEYNAYKKSLQAPSPTTQQSTGINDVIRSGETAGPDRVVVQEFDGFGPTEFGPQKTNSEF